MTLIPPPFRSNFFRGPPSKRLLIANKKLIGRGTEVSYRQTTGTHADKKVSADRLTHGFSNYGNWQRGIKDGLTTIIKLKKATLNKVKSIADDVWTNSGIIWASHQGTELDIFPATKQ